MASLMLVNPRRRKRRTTKRARRRNPETRAARRTAARRGWARRRRNPSIRHHARRAISRARSSKGLKGITEQITAGAIGATGGIVLDIAMAKLPLPAMMKSGIGHTATKIAGAVGVAMLGRKFLKGANADALAIGTMATVLHDAARDMLAPHIAMNGLADMGYYSPGFPAGPENASIGFDGMGEYVEGFDGVNGLGEYVEGYTF